MVELKIPRECYKYSTGEQQIASENNEFFKVTGISYSEDIKLQIEGCNYPWKVYTDQETLFATNQVKSLFIENIKLLTRKQFILGTIYTFIRAKERNLFIERFNHQAFRILSPFILKDWHLSKFSQELHWCLFTFLHLIGIDEKQADRFSEIFVHLLEYDNAYRFRFVDLMNETTKEELQSPRKAIQRLIKVTKQRDGKDCGDKYIRIAQLLSYGLYVPKIKKAFLDVVNGMKIENLQPDESDKYWMCMEGGYPFFGMTNEQRKQIAVDNNWQYPKKMVE